MSNLNQCPCERCASARADRGALKAGDRIELELCNVHDEPYNEYGHILEIDHAKSRALVRWDSPGMDTWELLGALRHEVPITPAPPDADVNWHLNQTSGHAFQRVLQARAGSNAHDPSNEYLLTLQSLLHGWIGDIQGELNKRIARHDKATR